MTTATHKPNLAGLSRAKLRALFTGMDEKPFRAEQILKWIHQRGVLDIDLMTDISKDLREELKQTTEISLPKILEDFKSEDGTRKWIVEVAICRLVQMVFIPAACRVTF